MEFHHKISMPNCQKLKTVAKRTIGQKLRLRNFDARHEKIETGAVVTSRRRFCDIERGRGICYRWKAKGQCSRGDQCSFRHESHDRAKPTPKAAPSSEPSMTREKGTSEAGVRLGSPMDKGTFTEFPCDCWHPPECQFFCKIRHRVRISALEG